MKNFQEYLFEDGAGLSRVWNHIQKYDCAIMSAHRSENSPEVNKEESDRLIGIVKKAFASVKTFIPEKLAGPIKLRGIYEEILENGEKVIVQEESIFIINIDNKDISEFVEWIVHLGVEFNQDSVIVIPKKSFNAYLISTSNRLVLKSNPISLGKISFPQSDSDIKAATKIKGKSFTFKI